MKSRFGAVIVFGALLVGAFYLGKRLPGKSSNTSQDSWAVFQREEEVRPLSEILRETDPIRFRSDYLAWLRHLTKEEAEEAAKLLWSTPGELQEIKERQKLFSYAWGQLDGEGAIQFIMMNESRAKVSALSQALAGWATVNPDSAKQWVENQLKPSEKLLYRWALVDGWGRHDPDRASDYVMSLENLPGRERLVRSLALEQSRRGSEESQAWIETLPPGELRQTAVGESALWWTRDDPVGAMAWASELEHQEERRNAVTVSMQEWARNDPAGAVQWLESAQPGSAKDHALSAFVFANTRGELDPVTDWAMQIADPGIRERTLVRVANETLQRFPDRRAEWLEKTGLTEEVLRRRQ